MWICAGDWICFDEIDNSRPFMIIFLGDRWGWVPDRKFVSDEIAKKFDSVDGKSVTALEIEYGLNQKTRAVICIRKEIRGDVPESYTEQDSGASKKLDTLKESLYKNHRASIIEYAADFDSATGRLENFRTKDGTLAEAILAKLRSDCAAEWNRFENLPWQSRELETADNFAKSRAALFVERAGLVANLKEKLENSQGIFLQGEPGSGKTSLACKAAVDLRAKGISVCNIFCGTSPLTSNAQSILQLMIYFLAPEYCKQISEPVYFVIDAVEMLDADKFRNNLEFLPAQSEKVHFLVTCATDFEIPMSFHSKMTGSPLLEMPSLADSNMEEFFNRMKDIFFVNIKDEDERQTALNAFINEKDAKAGLEIIRDSLSENASLILEELAPLQVDEIVSVLTEMLKKNVRELYPPTAAEIVKKKNASSPLYLEMTAQMLNMIASPELTHLPNPQAIIPLTVSFIKGMPDDLEEAAVHIIREAMARLEILQPKKVIGAINLMAVSRHGLRLSDLQALLKNQLNPLDWSRVQKYLHNFFVERQSGQVDFAHKSPLTSNSFPTVTLSATPRDFSMRRSSGISNSPPNYLSLQTNQRTLF